MPGLSALEERFVKPFYLSMMRYSVLSRPIPYEWLHELAGEIGDEDVTWLLRAEWRPRVMGAWFTAGREDRLRDALLHSLATSAGSLTAPPLAAVAVRGLGAAAVPALQTYLAVDLDQRHGAAAFIVAALDHLGAPPEHAAAQDRDRRALTGMLAVADRLAAGRSAR